MSLSSQMTAQDVIQKLGLEPLPFEGGYFRRTYECSAPRLPGDQLGLPFSTPRFLCTAIYYLVTPEGFSALHRVQSDEMFHFYAGDPVEMVQIDAQGELSHLLLGTNLLTEGELPQRLVPRLTWQGLRLCSGGRWALLGTTVSPGFEFEDFELADRSLLTKQFPKHGEWIRALTRALPLE